MGDVGHLPQGGGETLVVARSAASPAPGPLLRASAPPPSASTLVRLFSSCLACAPWLSDAISATGGGKLPASRNGNKLTWRDPIDDMEHSEGGASRVESEMAERGKNGIISKPLSQQGGGGGGGGGGSAGGSPSDAVAAAGMSRGWSNDDVSALPMDMQPRGGGGIAASKGTNGVVASTLMKSPSDQAQWRAGSLRHLFSLVTPGMLDDSELPPGRRAIVDHSMRVLRENDLGGYTIPTQGLYPFQWNWDSAIVAAGWAVFDEPRAWQEIEMLMSGQWSDGMVPSILFHRPTDSYFPGPEIWGSKERPSPSTGITQPPVATLSVRFLYEHAVDKELAREKMELLFPKLLAWHRWWYKARDPLGTGVVAILHPWESGMDNSPAWDEAMQFPIIDLPPYQRRDLTHVDAAMRPDKATYDRYLTLLYTFKNTNFYDSSQLYHISPFRVTDLCVNSILLRANRDLRWLALKLGHEDVAAEIEGWLDAGFRGFETLWDEHDGIFKCKDQLTGKLLNAKTSAGFLPLFAGAATKKQAARLAVTLKRWQEQVPYGVPSTDPSDPRFEALRYWRGPVWLIINWMVSNGLKHYGLSELAEKVRNSSLHLTSQAGLHEYFDPLTGAGAGGANFSWTAAMCLAWLDRPAASAIGHRMSGPKRPSDMALNAMDTSS
ncbi:unnamed protein product [Closterium sp. Yama58-4]|nr:unnamed protein product [Closterium sp. Yama58-4]